MKTIITAITFFLLAVQGAVAQQTIEDIRKAYASAKEYIGRMSDDFPGEGIPPEYYHLHVSQMLPATGLHREDIRLYYNDVEEENKEEPRIYPLHYLRFASTKYNYAAREFYEEYLYDERGQVMFIYAISPDVGEDMMPYELRLWYDGKRLLRFQAKRFEGKVEYLDLESLNKGTFKEEYSGTTIPERYLEESTRCQQRAQGFLQMFKSIEDQTYNYN